MSQAIWSTINPATTSGTQLATLLNDFKNALMSGLSGTSRPTQLQAGGTWIDTTLQASPDFIWTLKIFDGSADITLFTINLATGSPSITGADGSFTVTKISENTAGAILNLLKERVTGNGQVLDGDTLAEIVIKGTDDTGANVNVARIRALASDNYTTAQAGSEIVLEAVSEGQTALSEIMRLRNGRVGIGTTAPASTLHVLSTTGVRFERNSDDANGSILAFKKKRVTGTGQVQNNDVLAQQDFYGSDDTGVEAVSARIQAYAIENQTTSAKGARLKVQTILAGASTLTDRVIFGSTIQFFSKLQIPSYILDSLSVPVTGVAVIALSTANAIANLTGTLATDIQGIDATGDTKVLVIHNNTTADITLKHEHASATATNRLSLTDGDDVTISPRSSAELFYHAGDSRWKVKSGSGSGGGAFTVQTSQNVAAAGTIAISLTKARQIVPVAGNAAAVTTSITPFGTGPFKEGMEIEVVCTSNTNSVEIPFSDASNGCVGNFESITLNQYQKARFVWISALSRFVGGKL